MPWDRDCSISVFQTLSTGLSLPAGDSPLWATVFEKLYVLRMYTQTFEHLAIQHLNMITHCARSVRMSMLLPALCYVVKSHDRCITVRVPCPQTERSSLVPAPLASAWTNAELLA